MKGQAKMATPAAVTLAHLILFAGLVAATQSKCADMNPQACVLLAQSNPNLCNDNYIADSVCPGFCHKCPIECYHCNIADNGDCITTKLCAKNEVCMQKVLKSSLDGHREYQLSCERKELCDGGGLTLNFGKRGLEVRDVSITCCYDNGCNYPGAGHTVPPTSAPSTTPQTTEAATTSTTHSTTQMTSPSTTSEPITTSITTTITSPVTSQQTTGTTTQVASPQTTATPNATVKTSAYFSNVLSESLCNMIVSSSTVCSELGKATSAGCLASCGYCDKTTSAFPATTAIKRDCLDIYKSDPQAPSGKYEVTVTLSDGSTKSLVVWCDMTHGGGWTVFQKRFDGHEDFYKGIKQYENGFGNVDGGEFWLGLEHLYQLTNGTQSTLRVDVTDYTGAPSYEEYSGFSVDGGPEYRLHVGSKTQGTADGKMHFYDGAAFSTHDMDRDTFTAGNCAERFHGAFWYHACLRDSNVNGLYKPGPDTNCLYYAMTFSDCNGNRAIEMKFRRNA